MAASPDQPDRPEVGRAIERPDGGDATRTDEVAETVEDKKGADSAIGE
jgi:hypothetical protein